MEDENKTGPLILWWNTDAGSFDPTDSKSDGIFLERDDGNKLWLFSYTPGTGLIARRTALRRANEISKTGYIHPLSKLRTGIEYTLKELEDPYANLPDSIKSPQRTWYERKDEHEDE